MASSSVPTFEFSVSIPDLSDILLRAGVKCSVIYCTPLSFHKDQEVNLDKKGLVENGFVIDSPFSEKVLMPNHYFEIISS